MGRRAKGICDHDMVDSEEYDGPVIQFYVTTGYVGSGHYAWAKAPEGWATMTEDERDKFLQEESQNYRDEHIEYGATPYDSPEEARERTRRLRGNGEAYGASTELEDWF